MLTVLTNMLCICSVEEKQEVWFQYNLRKKHWEMVNEYWRDSFSLKKYTTRQYITISDYQNIPKLTYWCVIWHALIGAHRTEQTHSTGRGSSRGSVLMYFHVLIWEQMWKKTYFSGELMSIVEVEMRNHVADFNGLLQFSSHICNLWLHWFVFFPQISDRLCRWSSFITL